MSEIMTIDVARPDAPAYPPVEPFLEAKQGRDRARLAHWIAWLLLNDRRYNLDHVYACDGRRYTMRDVAARLQMVAGDVPVPDLAEAYDRWDDRMLKASSLVGGITWDSLARDDANFPWLGRTLDFERSSAIYQIDALNSPPRVTAEAIASLNITWREREQLRMISKIYIPPAWKLDPIPDHYAHVSIEKEALIAYTMDAAKGERDIQTQIKPGRYLKKFYPQLSDEEINRLQAKVSSIKVGVQFATEAKEITKIFRTGPQSCMSYDPSQYALRGRHPTEAYGNCDLQIAYVCNRDGKYTARTQVWPEKKVYNAITYGGDREKLQEGLHALGYKPGSLEGARIRKLIDPSGKKYIVPAIDGFRRFKEDGDWLQIDAKGDLNYGTGPGGYIAMPEPCAKCGGKAPNEAKYNVPDLGLHCEACLKLADVRMCDGDGRWHRKEDLREVKRKNNPPYWFGGRTRENHAFYCHGSRAWYFSAEFRFVTMAHGLCWEKDYFLANGREDPATGLKYPKEKEAA